MEPPPISITLSLSPSTYHFTIPPTLNLTITSHASQPITIFTWETPFNPKRGLIQNCFSITDITTDEHIPIPQATFRIQRRPFSRARDSSDEGLFLTLYPNTAAVVSTGFSRNGGKVPPEPRAVVERGRVREKEGNELKIRRSSKGCGVDGLEGGHRYRVNVMRGSLMGVTWWWGTKEEVMVDPGALTWNLLPGEQSWLDVGRIEGVEFSVEWSLDSANDGISQNGDGG